MRSSSAAHTISAERWLSARTQAWSNSSSSTFLVSGNVNTAGNGLTVQGTGSTTLSGAVSGAGTLTENADPASTLTLSGATANTYTGHTTVTSGTLALNKTAGVNAIVGDGVSSKETTDILVNGGTLLWNADNQLDHSVSITMTSGAVNLNGHTETFFEIANSGGAFTTGAGANLTVTDPAWSGGTNTISNDSTASFGNLIVGGGTNTVQGAGAGTNGGVLTVGAGGLSFSGTASPTLTINSDATSAGKVVLAGNVTSTISVGTATITSGGSAANPGTLDLGSATRTFSVTGNQLVVSAPITSTLAPAAGITKTGAGTLVLAALNNTYGGATDVQAGTLLLNGSLTGTGGGISVSNSASLLGGTGSTTRTVTINGGAVIDAGLTPGADIGTLNLGGLNLAAPSTQLNFQLTSDGTLNDLLNVSNTLTITGGQVTLSLLGGATATAKTYHLIDYATLGGSGSLSLATTTLGTNHLHASLVVNAGNNSIDLLLTAAGLRTWTGSVNSNWNLSTGGNWNPPEFGNGDDALFDDTATRFNVTLDNANGAISPNSVTFNNSTNAYTLSGPGSIAGGGGLTKNGTALVTIGTAEQLYRRHADQCRRTQHQRRQQHRQ